LNQKKKKGIKEGREEKERLEETIIKKAQDTGKYSQVQLGPPCCQPPCSSKHLLNFQNITLHVFFPQPHYICIFSASFTSSAHLSYVLYWNTLGLLLEPLLLYSYTLSLDKLDPSHGFHYNSQKCISLTLFLN
jgi:hypothetical protein